MLRKQRHRIVSLAGVAALAAAASLTVPAFAGAIPYKPPSKKLYAGVSDTGSVDGYNRFTSAIGKHLPILETFHAWGTKPGGPAYGRWTSLKTRPMLHISTREGGGPELITPGAIAGGEGDDYLINLNRTFGANNLVGYIRPFGEMNGGHNPYCAYNISGSARDAAHSTAVFKQAWKRIVIIIRGGDSVANINARLARLGQPPIKPKTEPLGAFLYGTQVAFVWTPQLRSLPNKKGNAAKNYYPGKNYVDWVGTDIFSNSANFTLLNSFYKQWRKKGPFAIGEWSVALSDNSRFVKSFMSWVKAHKSVRMTVYYQGFGDADPYSPYQYPSALGATGKGLRSSRYIPLAPEY